MDIINNNRVKFIILGVSLFVIGLVAFFFFTRSAFVMVNLDLPYEETQRVQVDGTKLRVFNGVSFYSFDLTNNTAPTIHGGSDMRLPHTSSIIWADDKGVLLTFDYSFINSVVSDNADIYNLSQSSLPNTTWWYDFSDNSVTFVSKRAITNSTGFYSAAKHGIYFSSPSKDTQQVLFFDTNTRKTSLVGSQNFASIESIAPCNKTVCVNGIDVNNPISHTIWTLKNNTFSPVYKNDEPIHYTGSNQTYFTYDKPFGDQSDGQLRQYSSGLLIDPINKTTKTVNRPFILDRATIASIGDDSFIIVGDQEERYDLITPALFGGYKLHSESLDRQSVDGLVTVFTPTSIGVLTRSLDDQAVLITKRDLINRSVITQRPNEVTQILSDCGGTTEYISETNTFSIRDDENDYKQTFKKIGECIRENPQLVYGYNFRFETTSPVNGRITSD